MAYADNLLNTTQNFMTPDFVNKFSAVLGEPADKIQAALKSVVPAFLARLVNKGSSPTGASSIVSMVKDHEVPVGSLGNISDPKYIQTGEHVVHDVFGPELKTVTSKLGETTGLGPQGVNKLMSMIAPAILGVVGSKIKNDNLNASGVQSFFSSQKSLLGLGAISSVAPMKSMTGTIDKLGPKRGILAMLIFLVLGAGYWYIMRDKSMDINSPQTTEEVERPFNTSIITQPSQSSISAGTPPEAAATAVGGLGKFLNLGSEADLPKRFSFRNLNFDKGTADLGKGSEVELDQIAEAMREFPTVIGRIEGFTDISGSPATNKKLSQLRANSVKDALVKRGVPENRLQAVGRGEEFPLAKNDTPEHMAMNRRIEFVVIKK